MLCFLLAEVELLKFHRYSQEKTMNWLKKKVLITTVLHEFRHILGKWENSKLVSHSGVAYMFLIRLCRWRGPSVHSRRETSLWERESNPQHTSEWSQSQTTMRVSCSNFTVLDKSHFVTVWIPTSPSCEKTIFFWPPFTVFLASFFCSR